MNGVDYYRAIITTVYFNILFVDTMSVGNMSLFHNLSDRVSSLLTANRLAGEARGGHIKECVYWTG